jgi:membrane protein DedA with SNARE-associated domain
VFFGTLLEGETLLIMAGFAARRGYLDLPWVMVTAFCGAVMGDQLVYFLAGRHGRAWLERRPKLLLRVQRAEPHVRRYGDLIIVGFRFLYGLRTVLPIAIALCGIPPRRFVPLNIVGAFLWVIAVGGAGYLFGQAVESVLDRAKKYELTILIGILAVGLLAYLTKRYLVRSREKAARAKAVQKGAVSDASVGE